MKLLAVEDDPTLQRLLVRFLGKTYEIIVANDGIEGLQQYCLYKPDGIITDFDMPNMNGDELVAKIRQMGDRLPIIGSSGNLQNKDRFMEVGCTTFIEKPYTLEVLSKTIEAYLR